jgi:phosphoglycolate phosphatase-like HAD superfamily hydrolase
MASETPTNYFMSLLEHLGLGSSFFGLADLLRRSKGLATRQDSELVEGSGALLEVLEGHYGLAVVTTRARPEAYAFIQHAGIERFFPVVITRQDVLRMKPHPEPVRKAAALLGVNPEECLMIGDTVPDMRAARRAGAIAVGVLSGFGERPELERAGAQLILERAAQILDYFPD